MGRVDPEVFQRVAMEAMYEYGLDARLDPAAIAEADASRARSPTRRGRDLRALPWISIDGRGARDLEQLQAVERRGGDLVLRVAVTELTALVGPGSAIDRFARTNSTSVYTAARVFPMLPPR